RSGIQSRGDVVANLVGSEDQHAGGGPCGDLAADVDAAAVRELEVEDDHVGFQAVDELDRVVASRGFAEDLDVRIGREDGGDACPHGGVVIDDNEARHAASPVRPSAAVGRV